MIIDAEYEEVEETDGELDLSEDDSLPWLEAEDEDDQRSDVDVAQIIGFVLILGTLAVGLIMAIWYYSNGSGDEAIVADGSTIEAPEGPVKERPDEAGGRQFAGTGDVAPVVGEGGTRDGVMDTDGNAGGDGESATGSSDADNGANANGGSGSDGASSASSASSSSSGVGVQLAAYSSRARAEQGWNDLARRTDALNGLRYRIEEGVVDIGTVYRLQAVAGDRAAADRLCAALKADGLDCQVKP